MLKAIGYIDNGGNMYLEPHNRHLLVYPLKDNKEEISFVLPD